MPLDINEPDWKRFKEVHAIAKERFAQKCLEQVQYHLTDKTKSAAERFFEIRQAIREREKERAGLFDDFRRSTALMQIVMMRGEKLITDGEMLRFSDELRDKVAQIMKIRD